MTLLQSPAMRRLLLLLPLWTLLLVACNDESDHLYSSYRAFFRYTYVETTPPLLTATRNPGMWCAINFPNGNYHFLLNDGRTSYTHRPTAADNYGRPECIAGFIVGTPNIPDFNGQFPVMAFDLVCPECYTESSIQRSLAIDAQGRATCSRCGRTYDLNNSGIVVGGDQGRRLFRYRVAASGNNLYISN